MRKKLLALITALALGGTSAFADNIQVRGAIVAGSANALTPTTGDLGAARSASTGALALGGATHSCTIDYGVSTAQTLTVPCAAKFTGGIVNTGNGIFTGAVVAGSATAPSFTSGDLEASRSTTTGQLVLGGTSSSCAMDYGITTASTMTVQCNFRGTGTASFVGSITSTTGGISSTIGIVNGGAAVTSGGYVSAATNVIAGNSNVPSVHGGNDFGVGTDNTDTPRALEIACTVAPGACGYGSDSTKTVSGISGEEACFRHVGASPCEVTFNQFGDIGARKVVSNTTPYFDFNGGLVAVATAHWEIQTTTLTTNPQTVSFTTAFNSAPDCTVSVSGGVTQTGHVAVTGTTTTSGVPVYDTATDVVTTMCYGV